MLGWLASGEAFAHAGVVGRVEGLRGSVVLGHPPDVGPDVTRFERALLSSSRSPNRVGLIGLISLP